MRKSTPLLGFVVAIFAGSASAQFCPAAPPGFFEDVAASDPFCGYITWMATNGITTGCANGVIDPINNRLYCPNNPVLRSQMAKFFYLLGNERVQQVNTGAGLVGGPITQNGTISLAATQLLPTVACITGQVPQWSGSAWTCSTVAGGGGTVTSITAGGGIVASPSPITGAGSLNLAAGYQLPQGCSAGQVPKNNGSGGWSCADANSGTVASVGTGSGLTGGPITSNGTINLAATNLLPTTACASGQVPDWSGSAWICANAALLDVAGNLTLAGTILSSVSNGHAVFGKSASNIALLGINGGTFTEAGGQGGVYGLSGSGFGVGGESFSGDGVIGSSTSGYAGHFYGNVLATGTVSAMGTISSSVAYVHALRGDSTSNIAILGVNGGAASDVGGNGGVYGISGSGFGIGGESSSGDGVLGSSLSGYAGHFYGNVLATGTISATSFNPTSDRDAKQDFRAIDPRDVLDKLVALPITRWAFKTDTATEHVGPMAQDFHAAFGVGTDDRHIATVDADGVAFAAIQGLHQLVLSKDAKIDAQQREIEAQRAELASVRDRLAQVESLRSEMAAMQEALVELQRERTRVAVSAK